ncbi:MAG TPA: MBL fold metallo-hydrolase [Mobilitalea sp.]|nr:MBL fold metallo-hydrolase [Mobilitalea sp.]
MKKIIIKTMVLGMVQTNCYIVRARDSKEAVVIDPADRAEKIYSYLNENDLVCKRILLTHGHFDHITAAEKLKEFTGADIYACEEEAALLNDPKLNASAHFGSEISLEPDFFLKDKEEFEAAGLTWQVIYTPGHTEGGACYYLKEESTLFSGDTLFYESIGRTDLPTGNLQRLTESIRNRLFDFPDETEVYPGHGRPTTIGHEKQYNPFL